MRPGSDDPELLHHFTFFIYPFQHALTGPHQRRQQLADLEADWAPWWVRLGPTALEDAVAASRFFLPYVRSLLHPELEREHRRHRAHSNHSPLDELRQRASEGLTSLYGRLPAAVGLRLTHRAIVGGEPLRFMVEMPGSRNSEAAGPTLAARLEWADAQLYPSGIGFLVLKARLDVPSASLSSLFVLNKALRLVHPPRPGWPLPGLRLVDSVQLLSMRDLIHRLLDGLAEVGPSSRHPGRWFGRQRNGGRGPVTDPDLDRTHGEYCQILSYACVDMDEPQRQAFPAGPFDCGATRALFEFAAGLLLGQTLRNPAWCPSPQQAERIARESRVAWWHCWQGMALKEGCVFLGLEDLPFNRFVLPANIENDYLPLYLYALHQKQQLRLFANDLMREVAQVDHHLQGARALLNRFVEFRNRFWFSEVTHKPQGGDLYRLMQQSLDVPGLFQSVTESVKGAREFYQDRWDRQAQLGSQLLQMLNLSAIFGALTVGYRFLATQTTETLALPWAVLGSIAALGTVAFLVALVRRWPRRRRRTSDPTLLQSLVRATKAPPSDPETPSVPWRNAA